MTLPSLTNVLVFFEQRLSSGRGSLLPSVNSLAGTLVTFEIVFAGLYLALGSSADIKGIARKILTIGFFYYVIQFYADILRWVVDGFLFAGESIGTGSSISFATLRDPGKVFERGLELVYPLVKKIFANLDAGWMGFPSMDSLWLAVCTFTTLLAFGLMSIQVFVTYLEYLLVASAGFLLIPFGIFKPTTFLAERVFGAIVAFGIKLMTLAVIIGISDSFLQTITVSDIATWRDGVELSVTALALAFLSLHAPSVAHSLLSGTPHLTSSTIYSAALAAPRTAQQMLGATTATSAAVLRTAGRVAGGAVAAMNSQDPISSKSTYVGKLAQASAKGALGVAGGAAGFLSGIANKPVKESIAQFKQGQWSVPIYRQDVRRRQAAAGREGVGPEQKSTQSQGKKE